MTSPKPEATAVARPKQPLIERLLALAKTPDDRARAWQIAERIEQEQAITAIVAEVRKEAWGNKVGPALQKEIVRWTLQQGGDPVTEVDVLGGQPYLNNKYWLRILSNEPDFINGVETQLGDDERLDEEARQTRRQLRAAWGVPEFIAATVGLSGDKRQAAEGKPPLPIHAALLVTLYFSGRGPFYGVKWCPSSAKDPIGVDFPEQTVRTRAWRKAALVAVRRKTPLTERLKQMIEDDRPSLSLPSGTVPLAEPERVEIAPVAEASAAAAKMVRHEPSQVCKVEGEHIETSCGYYRPSD